MNLPNKLTVLRILLIPIMVAVFYLNIIPYNFVFCAGIFVIASLTDFLDGYIARKYNLVTDLGKFLDPIADKVLVLSAFVIMLTNPIIFGGFGENIGAILGGVGVTIIVAREMIVSVLRMIAASKNVVLAAEKVGKIKTLLTDVCIVVLLCGVYFEMLFYLGMALYVISVLITVYSGIFYVVKNKGVLK